MFTISYDEVAGFIRGHCNHEFTVDEVQHHAARAEGLIARCRADHGDVKALIVIDTEVGEGAVMKAAQIERARILGGQFDRMAFVFGSSLAKVRMSRYFESESEKAFLSENAAITWLLADRAARAAPAGTSAAVPTEN